jgi:hypothetical protein
LAAFFVRAWEGQVVTMGPMAGTCALAGWQAECSGEQYSSPSILWIFPMTPHRQRFLDDLCLRNLSPRTIECYVAHVAAFARGFGRSPDHLDQEHVRLYQIDLSQLSLTIRRPMPRSAVFKPQRRQVAALQVRAHRVPLECCDLSQLSLSIRRPRLGAPFLSHSGDKSPHSKALP